MLCQMTSAKLKCERQGMGNAEAEKREEAGLPFYRGLEKTSLIG